MNHAEFRHRLHDILGPAQPPHDLAARALASIEPRPRVPHAWIVGAAIAAVFFAAVFAGTFAARSLHSAPRVAETTPSAPLVIGVPSSSAVAGDGPAPSPVPSARASTPTHSSSPTPTAARSCTSADIELTTKASAADYEYGQTVVLTTVARNVASTPCTVNIACNSGIRIYDDSGTPVFAHGTEGPMTTCAEPPSPHILATGALTTLGLNWNQRGCTNTGGGPCSTMTQTEPGTYMARGEWGYQSSTCTSAKPCSAEGLVDATAVTFTIGWPSQCANDGSMRANVSTDKSNYMVGATVGIKGTLTNYSGRACWFYAGGSGDNATPDFTVANTRTGTVWGSCISPNVCNSPLTRFITEPGQSYSWTTTWDQQQCSSSACSQVAPGEYTAYVWFPGAFAATGVNFTIGAG